MFVYLDFINFRRLKGVLDKVVVLQNVRLRAKGAIRLLQVWKSWKVNYWNRLADWTDLYTSTARQLSNTNFTAQMES
jgi:hypothetical protein